MPFLKPLEIQPKTVNIPFKDFNSVAVFVAKHEHCRIERVELEAALYQFSQTVNTFSHVRIAATQIYRFVPEIQHSVINIRQTLLKCSRSVPMFAVTRLLPISMVTSFEAGAVCDAETSHTAHAGVCVIRPFGGFDMSPPLIAGGSNS
jgi:hypothetical protein